MSHSVPSRLSEAKMFVWSSNLGDAVAYVLASLAVCLFVGGVVGMAVGESTVITSHRRTWSVSRRKLAYVASGVLGFMCVFLIANVVNVAATWVSTPNAPAGTARQATAEFGLRSDKQYQLILGQTADVGTSSAPYFTSATLVTKPAAALSVMFVNGDKSYVLDIPVARVTFVQSTTDAPGITLHIRRGTFFGFKNTAEFDRCDFQFKNMFAMCSQPVTSTESVLKPAAVRRGLAPLIKHRLESARVTLTPAMYQALLARNG